MTNRKKRLAFVYLLLAGVIALVILCCNTKLPIDAKVFTHNEISYNHNWQYQWEGSGEDFAPLTDIPVKIDHAKETGGNKIILRNHFVMQAWQHFTFCFQTTHQYAQLFINGRLVYDYTLAEEQMESSPGCRWHFVEISPEILTDKQGEVQLVLQSPYEKYTGDISDMYMGDKTDIIFYLFVSNLLPLILGCVIFLAGICMLAIYQIIKGLEVSSLAGALCLFTINAGVWIICESRPIRFFLNAPAFLSVLGYMTFLLIPITLMNLVLKTITHVDCSFLKTILWAELVYFPIGCILRQIHIIDYSLCLSVYHVVCTFTIILLFIYTYIDRKKNHEKRENSILVGVLVLLCSGLMDLIVFNNAKHPPQNTQVFFQFGILVFVAIGIMKLFKDIIGIYKQNIENATLITLAYHDAFTGLRNRTAYEEKTRTLEEKIKQGKILEDSLCLVMFDLNNLKHINDTKGHLTGDTLIKDCADMLRASFDSVGHVYKVGGDEFIAVSERAPKNVVFSCVEKLVEDIHRYNQNNREFYLSIAYGGACYRPGEDASYNDVAHRADIRMYEQKRKLKQENERVENNWVFSE